MKAYKIEIKLNEEQKIKFSVNESICRFLYNEYIMMNEVYYLNYRLGNCDVKFLSGFDFDKYINNTLSKDFKWIKNGFSKSRKQAIMNAENAFKRFFKGESDYPKYKKKKNKVGIYLPKNSETSFKIERHRVKIPLFGWVRLKEFGYISINTQIKSATVTQDADKYYISFLTSENNVKSNKIPKNSGIGIDLGIKELATTSDGNFYENINKSKQVKQLKKKLKREQRAFSRKKEKYKNKEVESATKSNLNKNILRVQKIYSKLTRIRFEYIKYVICDIVKQEPSFITIEDLNISGMMKNKHLSKAIQEQCFYKFRLFLIQQCNKHNIEVRLLNRWYPSSKLCSNCCGFEIDRDINASLNIRDSKDYIIIK